MLFRHKKTTVMWKYSSILYYFLLKKNNFPKIAIILIFNNAFHTFLIENVTEHFQLIIKKTSYLFKKLHLLLFYN